MPLTQMLLLLLLQAVTFASADTDTSKWVEYSPGTCNLLVSATHGGSLTPASIPRRTNGCLSKGGSACEWVKQCSQPSALCRASTVRDMHTQEIAATVVSELSISHNCIPHYVRANLHRSRVDLNREIHEAAQGDPLAESAWHRYHTQFMAQAVANISDTFGKGLVIDIHGQTHAEQWTEIGMLLTKSDLNNNRLNLSRSSILGLSSRSQLSASELVSGSLSFGGLLSSRGYKVVPSPRHPNPGVGGFFSGGFVTRRYGSLEGGLVDAIQVEINSEIRRDSQLRRRFAIDLAGVIRQFLQIHYSM